MRYTFLKDMKISTIALGTDVYGTDVDEKTAYELFDFYDGCGGNVIDTANSYADWIPGGRGKSEEVIGRWLKCRSRDRYIISTKGGFPDSRSGGLSRLSQSDIISDVDESLKRLGTDYIDIFWLHRDDENIEVGGIMETLAKLVKAGKTRYIGMSNWTYKRIDEANRYAENMGLPKISASQLQYSMAVPNVEKNDPTLVLMNDGEYEYLKKHNLNVFAFASQAKGFFSKLMAGGIENLSQKARDRYFNDESLKRFGRIREIAERYGKTVGETAMSALISNPDFKTTAIVGCKNIIQLKDTLGGWDFEVTPEEIRYIKA